MELSRSEYLADTLALAHNEPFEDLGIKVEPEAVSGRPDGDKIATLQGIRSAISDSGLTPIEFATAINTSLVLMAAYLSGERDIPAHVMTRLTRISAGLHRSRTNRWFDVWAASAEVEEAVANGEDRRAIAALAKTIRHLRSCFAEDRRAVPAWEAAPFTSGHRGWDVLFAALVRHEFEERQLDAPAWTAQRARRLAKPWSVAHPELTVTQVRFRTPSWLGELRVYVASDDLDA